MARNTAKHHASVLLLEEAEEAEAKEKEEAEAKNKWNFVRRSWFRS